MSVWEDDTALGRFVFQTVHRGIYARKHEFFEMPKAWIEDGLDEEARLDHLNAHGSDFAFGSDLPEKRCG